MNNRFSTNHVELEGTVLTSPIFDHESHGRRFYRIFLEVSRLSGYVDVIPVTVPEDIVDLDTICVVGKVHVSGYFHSCNLHEGEKTRLHLSVFAREIEPISKSGSSSDNNEIYLDGFLCKPPVYRKTPLCREVTDVILAVNRPYKKTDYIPCIFWGRNARIMSGYQVGDRCAAWGRIQSREYFKKISEENIEKRKAYEVSINWLNLDIVERGA